MCDPDLLRACTPVHSLHDAARNRVWERRKHAYKNVISNKMHPRPVGRSVEVDSDPRLQKKIAEMKGVEYLIPMPIAEEPEMMERMMETMVRDEPVGSFEQELGQAKDIMSEIMDMGEKRSKITILHFNDVYEIASGKREPVGGAARFVNKIKSYDDEDPLVLFSGDCANPSLLSTLTKGRHMAEVLNAAQVKVAVVGNHDFDFGVQNLEDIMGDCEFPWLCANAYHKGSGEPLCGAQRYLMLEHGGRRIGVMGLIEEEWLECMSCVDPTTIEYKDFLEVGQSLADELKDVGADIVIALTHFREHNDIKLLEEVEDIELVLGGHDHHYAVRECEDSGRWMVKSGTDFRTLSRIVIDFEINGDGTPCIECVEKVEITSDIPEDPEMAAFVAKHMTDLQAAAGKVLGQVAIPLEARFCDVRTMETNCGNWVADVLRDGCDSDVAICTAGTLRADDVFPVGDFTLGDLQRLLPFLDELAVVALSGATLLKILENGVSGYPKLEGRFPQVSGLRFTFDATLEPGSRVVPGSVVMFDGEALAMEKEYTVASMEFITKGKDGYDAFLEGRVIKDGELLPMLPSLLRNHMKLMKYASSLENPKLKSWRRQSLALALQSGNVVQHAGDKFKESLNNPGNNTDRSTRSVVSNDGSVQIAPEKDGRITCLGGLES